MQFFIRSERRGGFPQLPIMRYLQVLAAGIVSGPLFTVSVLAADAVAVPTAAPLPVSELSLLLAAICAAVSFTIYRRR